jgi:hypothetical protein
MNSADLVQRRRAAAPDPPSQPSKHLLQLRPVARNDRHDSGQRLGAGEWQVRGDRWQPGSGRVRGPALPQSVQDDINGRLSVSREGGWGPDAGGRGVGKVGRRGEHSWLLQVSSYLVGLV